MREIEKKRFIPMLADPFHGPLREAFRKRVAIAGRFNDGFVLHQRKGWPTGLLVPDHVIAIWEAVKPVEPLARWQEFRLIPKVPFSHDRRCVSLLLERFSNGGFIRIQPVGRDRSQHPTIAIRHMHPNALRIAACHYTRPRRGADPCGNVKMSEPSTLLRHAVEIRRAVKRRAKRFDIAVTEIVAEDDYEIRFLLIRLSRCMKPTK